MATNEDLRKMLKRLGKAGCECHLRQVGRKQATASEGLPSLLSTKEDWGFQGGQGGEPG